MTILRDSKGLQLPDVECPEPDLLRAYGDMIFLAFRSARHAKMPAHLLRNYLEPPLVHGHFRIFRFDGVPRGAFTWGRFGPDAERKLVTGKHLEPEDWNSGNRLWIVDILAPYRGLTSGIVRWIMGPGNFTDEEFLFRRVAENNRTRRIVHIDFRSDRLAQVLTDEDILGLKH
jgi:cytolysin-activating lysine-acyltransferase